jgi:hypothetical protein
MDCPQNIFIYYRERDFVGGKIDLSTTTIDLSTTKEEGSKA